MLLALLAHLALAHDYLLDATPDGEGLVIHGVVANDREREVRNERPETLTRLDRIADGVTAPVPSGEGWGRVPVGEAIVVYVNSGAEIELAWDKFRSYVKSEGDARMVPVVERLSREPQHEHYRRSLKLLIGPGGWDRVVGLPLELVPLDRPGSRKRIRVRLLAEGEPVAGARVRAFPIGGHADDDAVTATTDERGTARLRLGGRSLDWVYAAVVMSHDAEREPEWHSVWTTLRIIDPK